MPVLGIIASQISGHLFGPTGAYDSIATTTVGGAGAASITFSSIPSTYTHLQIRGINKTTAGTGNEWLTFQVNGATTNIAARHTLYGDGSTITSEGETTTQSYWFAFGSADSTASVFGAVIMDVLDYANTSKNKTFKTLSGWDKNGSGFSAFNSNLWNSTSAITSLTIIPRTNSFAQYTSFALYGIKGV